MIGPRPHRYHMTELGLNLGPADSKACTVLRHWLGLFALEKLPLPSSPVGVVSPSTLSSFTQPLTRVNGKRSWLAGPRKFSSTAQVGLCACPSSTFVFHVLSGIVMLRGEPHCQAP